MKSPRELLLERHRSRSDALDAIRERVIADEVSGDSSRTDGTTSAGESSLLPGIRAWLSFGRIVWSSFAAVWCAIIGLILAATSLEEPTASAAVEVDSNRMLTGFREHRARLAQLLDDTADNPGERVEPGSGTRPRGDADRVRKGAWFIYEAWA
jgi:hypothetical protein